jgi:SAM-dependent methyltransferase
VTASKEAAMSASPDSYTHGHHESVLRSHRWRTAENSAAYLLPHLRPGISLLDVGCGPGTITRDLATRLAPGRVVGIDPAEDAVAAALVALGPPAGAERSAPVPPADGGEAFAFGAGAGAALPVQPAVPAYEVGDAAGYAERHPGERFDVVHAHQVLQHVADPVGTLRAMAALTLPGGLVAARDSDYAGMAWYPLLPELDEWMRLYQAAARANGGEPDAGRRLGAWARRAGLVDVAVTASTWCFAADGDRSWWGGMWADRILESALARQVVETDLATGDDLRRISAGWRRWAEDPDGWFAVVHGEIVARVPA